MSLFSWFSRLFRRKKADKPIHSFVLLLDQPRFFDAETLSRIASRALGIPVGEEQDNFVVGEPPVFMLKLQRSAYLVNSFPHPYGEKSEKALAEIRELRLRKAYSDHNAWLSVDVLGESSEADLAQSYRTIGKLAAELAEGDCLAVFSPALGQMLTWEPELAEALRGDDPRAVFAELNQAPVAEVRADDPRMGAAVAEARQRWPEFLAAFQQRAPEQQFSVKAPVSDGQNTEFIWISVVSIDGDTITGDLGNDPVALRFMRIGDRVRVSVADLNDWMFVSGDQPVGGFTVRVLMDSYRR